MAKFSDFLLGFTPTENFVNIGAFAKQSTLFQTIAMEGGALANITWVFALIGFAYIALNPSSWKATVVGPWLFFLVLFNSGRLSDPLFFNHFDLKTDFENSYLDCSAIDLDAVPQAYYNKNTNSVEHRCIANEVKGSSYAPNSEHINVDADGTRRLTTNRDVLKLQGVDVNDQQFANIYAFSPQLYIIDTLVRLQAIMADALLNEMEQTASGLIQSARAARMMSLNDRRPALEANLFSQVCGDVKGAEDVALLTSDQAEDRHPDVMDSLEARKITLWDVITAYTRYYRLVSMGDHFDEMLAENLIRPPFVTDYTVPGSNSKEWKAIIRPALETLKGHSYANVLNWEVDYPSDLEASLETAFVYSSESDIPQTQKEFLLAGSRESPLRILYVSENAAMKWLGNTALNINKVILSAIVEEWVSGPSALNSAEYTVKNALENGGMALFNYLNGFPSKEAFEAFKMVAQNVHVNRMYFGNERYVPLAFKDVDAMNGTDSSEISDIKTNYQLDTNGLPVQAKQISDAVASSSQGVSCKHYHTYISSLVSTSLEYQMDMYNYLQDTFDAENKARMSAVARIAAKEQPNCVKPIQMNLTPNVIDSTRESFVKMLGFSLEDPDCNAKKFKEFVLGTGVASVEKVHVQAMREYSLDPAFSTEGYSGKVKEKLSDLGGTMFEGDMGDLLVSVVNAFQGFATGAFSALMPKIISWMVALIIVMTPFLYMMGLLVPVWGLSILLMPLVAILYLQSVQIVYVVIKGAFSGLGQFVTSGEEGTLHLAMYDMVLGLMYVSVFILTAFMLFNLNDAGALVKQMSGKLDSSATIDGKEFIGGAMAIAATAAVPGKVAGAALGAVKTAGNVAHSGNMLTNVAGTVKGAWNDGVESGIDRKHKNIANLGGSGAESMNFAKTVEGAAADATAKNQKIVATEDAFKQAGGGKAKTSAKVTRDGQEYDLGTGAGVLAGAVHEIHTDAKIAQEVTVNLVNEMANNDGFKGKPVLNAQTGQYEQQISPEMLSTIFQKQGAELEQAVAANKKFRTNDKGESFMVFGEVPGGSSSRPTPEPKEEQPKGKPTR